MRTHSQINFGIPYETRPGKVYPDILWARIESEPMWSNLGFKKILELNTVRQIIININESNMSESYRPIVIFYDGPETNTNNPYLTEEERPAASNIRNSQPIILNLNADFSGILYVPNSPVVLNGNGYNFKGFIVAKEYLSLKKARDFYEEDGKYYNNSSKSEEYFKVVDSHNSNNNMFVDSKGNVQYKSYTGELRYKTYENFGIALDNISSSSTNSTNLFTSHEES